MSVTSFCVGHVYVYICSQARQITRFYRGILQERIKRRHSSLFSDEGVQLSTDTREAQIRLEFLLYAIVI